MAETMLAATSESTTLHFLFNSMCSKHNSLFKMEHFENCDEIFRCSNIRSYTRKSKEQNILKWKADERRQAITEFKLFRRLTTSLKNIYFYQKSLFHSFDCVAEICFILLIEVIFIEVPPDTKSF